MNEKEKAKVILSVIKNMQKLSIEMITSSGNYLKSLGKLHDSYLSLTFADCVKNSSCDIPDDD